MTPRLHDQRGVILLEVLASIVVLAGGVLLTLGVFSKSGQAAYVAQRHTAMMSVAQRELERLRPLPYAQLGHNAALPSNAPTAAPLGGPAAGESPVMAGVVNFGPTPFSVQGVHGNVYRYVTWRAQPCPLLQGSVVNDVASRLGRPVPDVTAALNNLCPGAQQTKRITIVVKADDASKVRPRGVVRLSSVAVDPDSGLVVTAGDTGLKVDVTALVAALSNPSATPPTTPYADVTPQAFHLYDTPCSQSTRAAITANHATRDTSLQGSSCSSSDRPDLMGAAAPPGAVTDLFYDYSNDVTRPAGGGLALLRDDRAGTCTSSVDHAAGETARKRSVHTWATPASTALAETATASGRGTLTFWTRTAGAAVAPGRLCAVLRMASSGTVIGTADYALAQWPTEPTQMAVAFDLIHTTIPAGERLLLSLRVPSDSGTDLMVFHDHPAYASNLSLSMQTVMQ